jgi:hypothetical protein
MRSRRPIAAVVVASCVVLVGCSLDRDPVVLRPGEVTAGSTPSDHASPSDTATGTATPDESAVTATPDESAVTATPNESDDPATACGPNPDAPQSTSGARAVPPPFRDDQAELDVDGQAGNGRTVSIDEVQLSRTNGFVAVCTLDRTRLLGSHPIARSGDDRSVRVALDEPITTTTELLVVLFADNGDGHFDWATDPPVSGDDDDITDLEVERLTYRYTA